MLVESGAAIFATTISDVETAADKCEEMEEGYTQCSQFLYGRYIQRDTWWVSKTKLNRLTRACSGVELFNSVEENDKYVVFPSRRNCIKMKLTTESDIMFCTSLRCTGKIGCNEQRPGLCSLGLHGPAGWWAVLQRGWCPHDSASPWRHWDGVVVGAT